MLSSAELQEMQTEQGNNLPDSGTIWRKTLTSDGAGGQTTTTSNLGPYNCRVGLLGKNAQERVIAERLAPVQGYTVEWPAGTDIKEADQIIIGTRTLEVVGVMQHSYETVRMCICMEVR